MENISQRLLFAGLASFLLSAVPCGLLAAESAATKVKVELYVMSLCPFGVQAENALLPVLKAYGKETELVLGFIGGRSETPDAKIEFTSLHGQPETDENIRQICARKLAPGAWLNYLLERNKNYKSAEWKPAAEAAGLDVKAMETCAGGDGIEEYVKNLTLHRARNANSSPTIYIAGAAYSGPRTQEGFEWQLCSAIKSGGLKPPASCEKALSGPAPSAAPGGGPGCGDGGGGAQPQAQPLVFDIKVVTEPGAKACEPTLVDAMRSRYPAAVVKTIAADSAEGRELISLHKADALPLYVIDNKVAQDKGFQGLLTLYYAKSGGSYIIRPNPDTYTPCVRLERKRAPRHLDLFLESMSPRSMQALADFFNFMKDNSAAVKDLTFSVHYIVQETARVPQTKTAAAAGPVRAASFSEDASLKPLITSAQGEAEVREDLRQLCLFQNAPVSSYFDYVACRGRDVSAAKRSDDCLSDKAAIEKCASGGEGLGLLSRDAALVRELGITAGPAFLWENRYGPLGWNEADWKSLILGK